MTTACEVSSDSRGRVELFIYKSLSQQHQSNVLITHMFFFFTGTSNFNVSARIRTHYFDSRFVYFWKVVHTAVLKTTPHHNHQQKHHYLSVWNWRIVFPALGSLKVYSSCFQLFLFSFFTVKLHSYTAKYMFLNFSTQQNSIGRRNRCWKTAL